MFESLLVPLDQSKFSERSLPTAIALAGESGATLHLVHVHVPHVPYQYEGLDLNEYDGKDKIRDEEYLDEVARRVSGPLRDRPSTSVLDGPVPAAIERFADQSDADLIVITRHGQEGVSRLRKESVTDVLAREIEKPILILHPVGREARVREPTHFDEVLVCLDGSDASGAIREPARDLGQLGAHLTLLHVVGAQPYSPPVCQKEGKKVWIGEYLRSMARKLEEDCPSVRIQVRWARAPATAILRAAQELQTDLIALGTEGHGHLHRFRLGSVADEVLRNSPLPVLLRRPPIPA